VPPPFSSLSPPDTERAVSILKGILENLESQHLNFDGDGAVTDNLEHMLNVQGMLDKLESPLFASLQEIQHTQQQVS
jgi:hypothetical protein